MGQYCSTVLQEAGISSRKSAPPVKQKPLLSWQRDFGKTVKGGTYPASANPPDYAAVGLQGMKWQRLPGQINDQRINIDRCTQCQFFLLDQCDSVQIDECTTCVFFIGPTTGSIFIRNCADCVFVLACQQLRLRDVRRCTLSIFCTARPVVESSSELRFCCFSARHQYFALGWHLQKAKLSIFNNLYWFPHDFTPKAGGRPNVEFVSQTEFESSYDAAVAQLQAQGYPPYQARMHPVFTAVPLLSNGVPEYLSAEEEMNLYIAEVPVPFVAGISRGDVVRPEASFRTLLVFGSQGLDEAFRLVQAVELQRREYYALQGAGPLDQLVQLVATTEKIVNADDVGSMISTIKAGDFWATGHHHSATPGNGGAVGKSAVAHLADKNPAVLESSIRSLEGEACVFVLVASVVENPPLLAVHRTMAAVSYKASNKELLVVDVCRPVMCESMRILGDLIFCRMPLAGSGFGATH